MCCCLVKDRYGDRASDSGSESSESSSDDSEVVSSLHLPLFSHLLTVATGRNRALSLSSRNWTLLWKGTFIERCPCWRRRTLKSTKLMQNSTQKVPDVHVWLGSRCLGRPVSYMLFSCFLQKRMERRSPRPPRPLWSPCTSRTTNVKWFWNGAGKWLLQSLSCSVYSAELTFLYLCVCQ